MTLAEYLYSAEPDRIVLVGSGSSFFYIGTVEKMLRKIDLLNESLIKQLTKSDNEQKRKFIAEAKRVTEAENILTAFAEFNDLTPHLIEAVKNSSRKLREFKPILERKVLDAYPRLQGDGIAVKIEGIEIGDYWFKSEYDKENSDEQI